MKISIKASNLPIGVRLTTSFAYVARPRGLVGRAQSLVGRSSLRYRVRATNALRRWKADRDALRTRFANGLETIATSNEGTSAAKTGPVTKGVIAASTSLAKSAFLKDPATAVRVSESILAETKQVLTEKGSSTGIENTLPAEDVGANDGPHHIDVANPNFETKVLNVCSIQIDDVHEFVSPFDHFGTESPVTRTTSSSEEPSTEYTSALDPQPASITDSDFETTVLNPRGIWIDDKQDSVNPFDHFGTDPPGTKVSAYYRSIKRLENTTIWLEGDEGFTKTVMDEYETMETFEYCKAEYVLYVLETFKGEARRCEGRLPDTPSWMTERMVDLDIRPEGNLWRAPPVVDTNMLHKHFNFNVQPDCSYWLTMQSFSPDTRNTTTAHVRDGRILYPYLTIGIEAADNCTRQARNKVAAAAALELYNRHKLREACATTCPTEAPLRHYGITFVGSGFEVWCLEADEPESEDYVDVWTGCRMYRLYQASCRTAEGMCALVCWVHEIHRWGLSVHGPDCERDLTDTHVAREDEGSDCEG
ncbi:uncharacterized protein K452DRAFT_295416 [Aplosporella prunicola CBS 121167]|uniref:Uncharacterized protein n=1 Tax=Aplosporella prunicola CBS 121167 TaxID=1176127 RepID=A0A6A6BNZ8_9PEZI|nr:uncharacterized protein K452DRAFT_295416 [Aplosporella prunicola CBS 121167]KAF2145860.1 hypothetical protein K452DRAFT_295416 [Aplosporella prunicola CBS 121167]